jgi:hypothetical protein
MRNTSAFQPNGVKNFELASTGLFSDANLVAYWKFEGNSNDSKGSNNGTDTSVTYGTAYGKFNQGALYNGTTSKTNIGSVVSGSTARTVSAWVYPTTTSGGRCWYASGTNAANAAFAVLTNGSIANDVYIYLNTQDYKTGAVLTQNVWNHVVVTYDGGSLSTSTLHAYVNGVEQSLTKVGVGTGVANTTNSNFSLGYSAIGSDSYFAGNLDEIAVFSRSLSATEVGYLYSLGTTKAYYPLNGNSRDFSGNTNTGTDTAITYPQGRFGQGAKLVKASSSAITYTTNKVITGTGSFTVSGWVHFASLNASGDIAISVGHQTTNQQFSMGAVSGVLNGNWYGGAGTISTGTSAPRLNTWYHVCAVLNGASSTWQMYVNGRLYGTPVTAPAYNMSSSGSNGNIFGNYTVYDANWGFNGLIDEVIIESRAWTAKEVETYYRKSMLNYKQSVWAKFLQAFTISESVSLTESITNLRARNFSVSETTTLTESITSALGKIVTIVESVSLTETLTTTRTFLVNIAESVGLTEILAQVKKKWSEKTRSSSTWTEKTSNTSTFTEKPRSSSTWTEKDRS